MDQPNKSWPLAASNTNPMRISQVSMDSSQSSPGNNDLQQTGDNPDVRRKTRRKPKNAFVYRKRKRTPSSSRSKPDTNKVGHSLDAAAEGQMENIQCIATVHQSEATDKVDEMCVEADSNTCVELDSDTHVGAYSDRCVEPKPDTNKVEHDCKDAAAEGQMDSDILPKKRRRKPKNAFVYRIRKRIQSSFKTKTDTNCVEADSNSCGDLESDIHVGEHSNTSKCECVEPKPDTNKVEHDCKDAAAEGQMDSDILPKKRRRKPKNAFVYRIRKRIQSSFKTKTDKNCVEADSNSCGELDSDIHLGEHSNTSKCECVEPKPDTNKVEHDCKDAAAEGQMENVQCIATVHQSEDTDILPKKRRRKPKNAFVYRKRKRTPSSSRSKPDTNKVGHSLDAAAEGQMENIQCIATVHQSEATDKVDEMCVEADSNTCVELDSDTHVGAYSDRCVDPEPDTNKVEHDCKDAAAEGQMENIQCIATVHQSEDTDEVDEMCVEADSNTCVELDSDTHVGAYSDRCVDPKPDTNKVEHDCKDAAAEGQMENIQCIAIVHQSVKSTENDPLVEADSFGEAEHPVIEPTSPDVVECFSTGNVELDVLSRNGHDYCLKNTPDREESVHRITDMDDTDWHMDMDAVVEVVETSMHENKMSQLKAAIGPLLTTPYCLDPNAGPDVMNILATYPCAEKSAIKLNITINSSNYKAQIYVHRIELSDNHDIWTGLPQKMDSVQSVQLLLDKVKRYHVCSGNNDACFQDLVPVGSVVMHDADSTSNLGYREGDFGSVGKNGPYSSTIRSTKCKLLVEAHVRCAQCSKFRSVLRARKHRLEQKKLSRDKSPNFMESKFRHCNMSREDLIGKIYQQKHVISDLEKKNGQLKRQFQKDVAEKGVKLDQVQALEMKDLMASCREEVEKAFPDENTYQRLFWNEQLKNAQAKSSKGVRWHPMVIRLCLYLRQKSSAAYEALRDSGFITLPSSRTLFDYSHYTKSALGFQTDALKMLVGEATKKGMFEEKWKSYIGILFDEIRIKSDLVYDKHTGELIGFCNLDDVGNQMLEYNSCHQKTDQKSDLAKFMLVLMVRGVSSDLKFPFAAFATDSITADYLYPILWKAVRILESSAAKFSVLFFTCDGASANRRFFKMHSLDAFVHYTVNPHDKTKKIFFISDVPHLVKTTRNCFANSYSHRNTRKLWKDGKDISWLHILRLYEEHCELGLFNPCPKLSRAHVDLTAFSFMKVNLAAQVLSSTVANALELMYDENVCETVNFIRHIDKLFDCLNVRHLYEGRNKRNENLHPYNRVDDPRLTWLQQDFLQYFEDWEQSVRNRPGLLSTSQRSGMLLSHQTLTGLKMTVKSVVECVKLLLSEGVPFVLTSIFNQDPLEQHFGHYRHRGGENSNPTAYEVRNALTSMRAVGAQALNPLRGNVTRENRQHRVIDNTPLPRRTR